MIGLPLAAIAFSMAVLLLLWRGDPKRRRAAGLPDLGHGPALRRPLAMAALLPGLGLAILGDPAALLIWLGGCAVGGWLLTQATARR